MPDEHFPGFVGAAFGWRKHFACSTESVHAKHFVLATHAAQHAVAFVDAEEENADAVGMHVFVIGAVHCGMALSAAAAEYTVATAIITRVFY
jgi:hypothetical protein